MPRRLGSFFALLFFVVPTARGGSLKVSIHPPLPASAPRILPPETPPTAWEIPMPLLLAPLPNPTPLPRDLVAILIARDAPKAKARDIKVNLDGGRARPGIAIAAPGARVSFTARESVAIKFTSGVEESLVASKRRAVMRFDEPGIYSFVGQDDPQLRGHVVVGAEVEMREVPSSGELVVRNLAPGSWDVFLVSNTSVLSAGTVLIAGKGEETPYSFEYSP